MKHFKYIALMFVSVVIISCGDFNALEWSTNKKTTEAERDKLDFAFIEGNCQYVIEMLEPNKDHLTGIELYQYSNAVMACSGFDLLNSLTFVLDENTSTDDPYAMIQSFMGTSTVNNEKIAELKANYSKVLSNCNNNVSNEMQVLCGMTAAADSILDVSQVALTLSGEESIEMTEEGMKKIIEGKTIDEIQNAVTSSKVNVDLIDSNIDTVSNSSVAIENMAGNIDFSKELDTFTQEIRDSNTGSVTESSLSNYILNQFGGKATTPPTP